MSKHHVDGSLTFLGEEALSVNLGEYADGS